MTGWSHGYVSDITYTYGYYAELAPLRARFALLAKAIAAPAMTAACELGFGQGLSLNVHAAASTTEWFGTDFNASQANFAQCLSAASGAKVNIVDEGFEAFCHRKDLPDFDFVGLHGIWSWVSDENRKHLVSLIKNRLRVGGVLYISYNTMPGWAAFAPMRQFMTQYVERATPKGQSIIKQIEGALSFTSRFNETNPAFSRLNPNAAERFKKITEQNKHYLAHEYFNKDWQPMYFYELNQWLDPAKLSYISSAQFHEEVDAINLSPEQLELLGEVDDPVFQQTFRDFATSQQFRRDYWVKGPRRLEKAELLRELERTEVLLTGQAKSVSLKIKGALGEGTLNGPVYEPIIQSLENHRPKSIVHLHEEANKVSEQTISLAQVLQACSVLVGSGSISLVSPDKDSTKVQEQCNKLNKYIAERAQTSQDISFLASPVTGQGIAISRFSQMFFTAMKEKLAKTPEDLSAFVWNELKSQGQALIKNGETLKTAEENLNELKIQATDFLENQVPVLKTLKIV